MGGGGEGKRYTRSLPFILIPCLSQRGQAPHSRALPSHSRHKAKNHSSRAFLNVRMSESRTNFSQSKTLALRTVTQAGFLNHLTEMQSSQLLASESPRNKGYSRLPSWRSFSGSKSSFCLLLHPEQQKCLATSVLGAKAPRTPQTKKNICQRHQPFGPQPSKTCSRTSQGELLSQSNLLSLFSQDRLVGQS